MWLCLGNSGPLALLNGTTFRCCLLPRSQDGLSEDACSFLSELRLILGCDLSPDATSFCWFSFFFEFRNRPPHPLALLNACKCRDSCKYGCKIRFNYKPKDWYLVKKDNKKLHDSRMTLRRIKPSHEHLFFYNKKKNQQKFKFVSSIGPPKRANLPKGS